MPTLFNELLLNELLTIIFNYLFLMLGLWKQNKKSWSLLKGSFRKEEDKSLKYNELLTVNEEKTEGGINTVVKVSPNVSL